MLNIKSNTVNFIRIKKTWNITGGEEKGNYLLNLSKTVSFLTLPKVG